jgi:hypothetical protein
VKEDWIVSHQQSTFATMGRSNMKGFAMKPSTNVEKFMTLCLVMSSDVI